MNQKIEAIRHSLAHVLAAAVKNIYGKGVKFGIGPVIENGFYYDFEFEKDKTPTPLDFSRIENEMKKIIDKKLDFEKQEVTYKQAEELFKKMGQKYKLELLEDLRKFGTTDIKSQKSKVKSQNLGRITLYKTGAFIDLCRGGHVKNTKEIPPHFRLEKIAGAYWRGDEKNSMLTRIYAVAFTIKKELDDYIIIQEEATKRDHRKIGEELGLFTIDEEFGQGLPLWLPQGTIIRREIENFVTKEYLKRRYVEVRTPHIANINLWKRSGHWEYYRESMYPAMQVENEEYVAKPMNCPGHIKIYQFRKKSYKDLPLRIMELATVYRYERSGVLHGLTRVRGFTQDDAHIFCKDADLKKELTELIKLDKFILKAFGFKNTEVTLSVRDPKNKEKYLGEDKKWSFAENCLEAALKSQKWSYKKVDGEAAFYGPKIDVLVTDSIGRKWQLSTIQLDFNLPERFDVTYVATGGNEVRPFMIHRALLGSIERFTGILIEHYAGAFPLWLSPVQVDIIPVGSRHQKSCAKLFEELGTLGIRCALSDANETVSYKIRRAEKNKVPYMLVIGDKEASLKKLTVRERGSSKTSEMTLKKFKDTLLFKIEKRK